MVNNMSVSVRERQAHEDEAPEEEVIVWENESVIYHSDDSTDTWIMADKEDLASLEDWR